MVKQRYEYDCFFACVAMVSGQSYDTLFDHEDNEKHAFINRMLKKRGVFSEDCDKALAFAGLYSGVDYWIPQIPFGADSRFIHSWLQGRRALLQVDSLNNAPPAQHIVYWDGNQLHDPSNKQVYQWLGQLRPSTVWIFNELLARPSGADGEGK